MTSVSCECFRRCANQLAYHSLMPPPHTKLPGLIQWYVFTSSSKFLPTQAIQLYLAMISTTFTQNFIIILSNRCYDIVIQTSSSLRWYFGLEHCDALKISKTENLLFNLSTFPCDIYLFISLFLQWARLSLDLYDFHISCDGCKNEPWACSNVTHQTQTQIQTQRGAKLGNNTLEESSHIICPTLIYSILAS